MPIEYPVDFKRKIIRRYEKENPSRNLVKSFILHRARFTIGVSYSVLFRRRSIPTRPKEFDVLSRKLEKMEHEVEIIRLSGFLAKVPLRRKLEVLEKDIP